VNTARGYVLTGAPGSGKTAVLRLLEARGHLVVEEAATDVIALEQALGTDEPWTDPGFIDKIVTLQRQRQQRATTGTGATPPPEAAAAAAAEIAAAAQIAVEPRALLFFDRSPVCTLALSRYLGFGVSRLLSAEIDRVLRERIYQPEVFFVRNRGVVEPTAARRISFAESLAFERLHEEVYRDLGFTLIDVPAGPVHQRADLVLRSTGPITRPQTSPPGPRH
jgi:predicted ATPase